MDLYAVFINLTKASDTVNRDGLKVILKRPGSYAKSVRIIDLFREHITGQVLSNGDASENFEIYSGMKQGCVLLPVLFNPFFTCVFSCLERSRIRCMPLTFRMLNAKVKTVRKFNQGALFAEDSVLMLHTQKDL